MATFITVVMVTHDIARAGGGAKLPREITRPFTTENLSKNDASLAPERELEV